MPEPESTAAAPASQERALCWRFAECVVDERSLELTVRGQRVAIENKPLEVLLALLRHAGEVVTKDELLEQVWPGRIPSESVLTKAMAKLRQALGDEDQTVIKTVYGYGYKLVAALEAASTADPAATPTRFREGDRHPLRPNWRLTRQLGGGTSEVWLGENERTGEKRVFKFAADGDSLRNLKREITLFRVLNSQLDDHDGYVRLLDWNLEEPPYFIEAEFAEGGSLPQWIEAQGGFDAVPLETRLKLLARTAATLGAAHDAGVLHKDLKPANLVVTAGSQDSAQVKLTDFGSGRVIDEERLRHLEITRMGFTQTRAALDSSSGTPLYFAPELVAGHAPSTRSDIFALGVILYQLTIGDFRRPLAPGWERDVADELLREDIAACADTNPQRRLPTATLLAERLATLEERRSARAAELARKREAEELRLRVARLRARRGALIGLVAALSIVLAVVSVSLLRVRASEQKERAARAEAEEIANFLEDDVLGAADPEAAGNTDVPIRVVLDRAAEKVALKFRAEPLRAANVHAALGHAYEGSGESVKAVREIRTAIELSAALGEPGNVIWATAMNQLAQHYYRRDDFAAARKTLEELLGSRKLGDSDAEYGEILTARAQLGAVEIQSGSAKEGIHTIELVRDEAARRFGADDDKTLALTQTYSAVLGDAGRHAEAIAELRTWIAAMEKKGAADSMDYFNTRASLAQELVQMGSEREALPLLESLYAEETKVLGADNLLTVKTGNNLAVAYDNLDMKEKSARLYLDLIARSARLEGEDADLIWGLKSNLATLYMGEKRYAEAQPLFQAVYDHELKARGESTRFTLKAARDLARNLQWLGRWEEAATIDRRVLALGEKSLDPKDILLPVCNTDLARSLGHLGHPAEARRLLDGSIAALTAELGADHRLTQGAIATRDELPAQ